jgi:hypothetical protein
MRRSSLTLCWSIKVLGILLALSQFCSPQSRSKQVTPPERTVLRQLHSELVESDPPKGIRLLAGYKHKGRTDFEGNQVGEILKRDGVHIKYEIGFSQGLAVDPDQKATYLWYREQKANGRITRYALSKKKILLISFALDDAPNSLHAANFYGEIRRPDDIADMLLMLLPLAYS